MNRSVLVTAEELQQSLTGERPPLVFDCRVFRGGEQPGDRLYLPASVPLSLEEDLSAEPGAGGRHPLPSRDEFTVTLQSMGVTPGRPIVVYDDSGGQLAAARAWWMIACWAGHPEVRVLDGGVAAWQMAGEELVTTPATPGAPSRWVPSFDDEALVSADLLAEKGGQLVDARAMSRFRGLEEPLDPIAGHIPGAVCRPCAENLEASGQFKPPRQLANELPKADRLTAYCGSGVTACHNILAYAVAGLPLPRLYPGSWSEWIRDSARPIATGDA
ncbi:MULTISPECIES: sulfurtransferase [Salinicola]|uniref:Sulfurtransferase n=1 Tax=Salinicola socius TaxID=404433 RepID=A0A1Q8SW21_9GAMM|nr:MULTISPECIES: sulfurtransferase [Salinicola]OLO05645.1 sulfurtransferase [Salinicola socius]